jgi:hypothetical protein
MEAYIYENLRCTQNNTKTVGDQDFGSCASDSQSECPDIAYCHCPSSIPIHSASISSFSISDTAPSTITPNGIQRLTSLPEGTPTYSTPLTAANLASFNALPTGQGYASLNNLPINQRGPEIYVWFCSNCGDGPHNITIVASCIRCNHTRCSCCVVEKS